ncbi:hypothetical protein BG842_13700 [Haladaptatus sp. W1]|uniref:hypothetical protein n=1 Tax=Haladaptatus sp. W1 TaxID=1897478 RepID=UPI0008497E62|nr:hypothetical protein [Haladaptatus sp. W1]ODR80805.1 hypothetical protein BG842_13700 [Haladaptatus sp. W1]
MTTQCRRLTEYGRIFDGIDVRNVSPPQFSTGDEVRRAVPSRVRQRFADGTFTKEIEGVTA